MLSIKEALDEIDTSTTEDEQAPVDEVETDSAEPTTAPESQTDAAARMLELAAGTADQLVTDAQSEAESLVTTAQAKADAILEASRTKAEQVAAELARDKSEQAAELDRERASALSGLADEKAALEASIASLRQAKRQLALMRSQGLADAPIQIVVNRVEKKLFRTISLADVERALGHDVGFSIANDFNLVSTALDQGILVSDVKAGSKVSKDIKDIVEGCEMLLARGDT